MYIPNTKSLRSTLLFSSLCFLFFFILLRLLPGPYPAWTSKPQQQHNRPQTMIAPRYLFSRGISLFAVISVVNPPSNGCRFARVIDSDVRGFSLSLFLLATFRRRTRPTTHQDRNALLHELLALPMLLLLLHLLYSLYLSFAIFFTLFWNSGFNPQPEQFSCIHTRNVKKKLKKNTDFYSHRPVLKVIQFESSWSLGRKYK